MRDAEKKSAQRSRKTKRRVNDSFGEEISPATSKRSRGLYSYDEASALGGRPARDGHAARDGRPTRDGRVARVTTSRDPQSPRSSSHTHATTSRGSTSWASSRIAGFVSSWHTRMFPNVQSCALPLGRKHVLSAILAIGLLAVFARLIYLKVIVADEYSANAEETRTITFTTNARRGTIYDRNGTVLAVSVDATTIYANPSEVSDVEGTASALAEILGGDKDTYVEKLSADKTTFSYIKRQADVDAADEVKSLDLDGIYFISDMRREYPCGQIGGQVVGFCNVDGEGITGLELQYNDILSGTGGVYSAERGQGGIPIPGGVTQDTPAVDGQDIMISLDIELQEYVETTLADGTSEISAQGGSCVVMDGETGEIYAAASLPYLNPSDMSVVEEGADQLKAVTQAYEPGSIFKTVSVMTLLENDAMSPDDELFCPAVIEADGYKVSDSHERDDATFTLRQILDQSSNVGISLSVENMGFDKLYDNILKYNLNEPTGVDYPGEASGYLQPFTNWARITGYNVSFGQGISVTPLQMVRFYGALVNDGVETTPHFLISKPQTGETPTYATERVIDDDEAIDTMVDMLKTVVTDGTGKGAQIEGFQVAGKTSTAEVAEGGTYKENTYNLGFIGFLADSSSQLVCFVGANEVPSTGNISGIFKDIMTCAIDRFKISPE